MSEALDGITLLAIDSVALIYLVERHPTYFDRMVLIARHITYGQIEAISSALTLAEVLVHPLRANRADLIQEYDDILQNSRGFQLVSLTPAIARKAAELRATFNLKTPDAIHIATAIESVCDAFLTNDHALNRVNEIKVLVLDELELPEEGEEEK